MKRPAGSIAVPRSMFVDDPFWNERRPRTQFEAWLDVVQMATHAPYDHPTEHGVVHLDRGEVLLSRRFMAARWGWSEKVVRRWLESGAIKARLRAERRAYDGTVYRVVHYDTYNPVALGSGQDKGPEMGHERATKRPKNDNRDNSNYRVGSLPTSETSPVLDPSSTSEPLVSPSVVHTTSNRASSLERLPKASADLCFTNWTQRFGALNYGRLRSVLLDCVDAGIPHDQLPDAVIAYHEWYDSLSERDKQFNRPSPQRFAAEAQRWARLGQMDYVTLQGGITERGRILSGYAA